MTLPFTKRHAPSQLQAWLRTSEPAASRSWEELPTEVKTAIRERLHEDQRCLCCYCYVRVACDEGSHIEHVEPQSSENRFDWQNLALACDGGNKHGYPAHCDHAKGQERLDVVHPYKAPVIRFVSLGSTGALKVQDEAARRDVDAVLNLNARRLQSLRRSALQSALADLHAKRGHKDWKPQRLAQSLADLQRRPTRIDYQPLIEGWLERQLRRKS
jgi:uncharacterized protein (TIGR02646 family)